VAQHFSTIPALATPVTKTTDIGEKLDPLDVVFGGSDRSQPAVIAVKGSVFG
jgi:hypothetical protein